MRAHSDTGRRVHRWLAVHETRLAQVYLLAVVLGVLMLGFAPARGVFLGGMQSALTRWDERWSYRVDHGIALVAAGQYEEAIGHLEALNRAFPATNVRHGRDQERERILRALGEAYEQTGRKGRALAAFREAVAFDPLNYVNHEALADAALAFDEPAEASTHLREILALNPGHLGACAKLVSLQHGGADWRSAIETYRAYVEGYVVRHLVVELGAGRSLLSVQADGRWHEAVLPLSEELATALATHPRLALGPGALGLEVSSVVLEPPIEGGRFPTPELELVAAGELRSLAAVNAVPPSQPRTAPVLEPDPDTHPSRRLVIEVPAGAPRAVALRLKLRLVKPVDPATWSAVEAAHRNLLEFAELEQLRARSFTAGEGAR